MQSVLPVNSVARDRKLGAPAVKGAGAAGDSEPPGHLYHSQTQSNQQQGAEGGASKETWPHLRVGKMSWGKSKMRQTPGTPCNLYSLVRNSSHRVFFLLKVMLNSTSLL